MSKRIEHFIEDNRREFDSEIPSNDLWNRIETGMSLKKEKRSLLLPIIKWSLSAAAVLMISMGAYFMFSNKPSSNNPGAVAPVTSADVPEVTPFIHMISMKQEELKLLSREQPELYHQFTEDIVQLDSSYQALKNQVSISPNREMLLQAMIHNLQLQLEVLNQQLNIIQQVKQKKYSHEKVI